jgi:hypothetical protein
MLDKVSKKGRTIIYNWPSSQWCEKKWKTQVLDLVLSRMGVWSTIPNECPVWFDARKNNNNKCRTMCYIIISHKNIWRSHWFGKNLMTQVLDFALSRMKKRSTFNNKCSVWFNARQSKQKGRTIIYNWPSSQWWVKKFATQV